MTNNIAARTPYQGLQQVFRYNRPFYVCTLSGMTAAVILSVWLPLALRVSLLFVAAVAAFWACASLLVSHYIYDRSAFYSLTWLCGCLLRSPVRWINLHAGIDETSVAIASRFPSSQGRTADIYDPREMTEPSIQRARRLVGATLSTTDRLSLPAADQEFDTAFLIFAAHEFRHAEARARLFREVARVLCTGGELILVEHARDWANFLAFGPGFLHFFSRRIWQDAAGRAGLSMKLHRTVTPFVHLFVFRRQC